MKRVATIAFGLLAIYGVEGGGSGQRKRDEHFSRIGKYEEVDVSFDSELNILSFNGFGESYKLLLEKNERMIPNGIKHTNGIPKESSGYFSSLTQSCHYQIDNIINDNNNNKNTGNIKKAYGAISICDKRGVRGRIRIRGDEKSGIKDTIVILPSNYYLNFDNVKTHDISDKHLIYRMSDFNTTGLPSLDGINDINVDSIKNNIKNKHKGTTINKPPQFGTSNNNNNNNNEHGRKLQAYNNGQNDVEMFIFADAGLYLEYYEDYGSDWYDELEGHFFDVVNDASSEFEETDWGDDVGTVTLNLVELEVAQDFSGDYASLDPTADTPNSYDDVSCSDWTDVDSCTQDSGWNIGVFNTWVNTYKSWDDFDNAALYTGYAMSSARGYFPGMCMTWSITNVPSLYYDWDVHAMEHEVGHNFWMDHDQDTTCGNDGGLMGYGSNWDEFSECSIAFLQDFFDTYDSSCMGDGVRSYTSNEDDVSGGDDDDDDDNDYDFDCDYYSCISFYNFNSNSDGVDLNIYWTPAGCNDDKAYYTGTGSDGNTYYLYYTSSWSGYHVDSSINYYGADIFCYDNPVDCSYWWVWDGSSWGHDSDAVVYDCGSYVSNDDDTRNDDSSVDNEFTLTNNCSDYTTYGGEYICMYNSGSLWDDGVASFKFDGCRNDVPFYYYDAQSYSYSSDNSDDNGEVDISSVNITNVKYYLYYDNGNWIVGENTLQDTNGVARCEDTQLLSDCTYDTWYVLNDDDDMVSYELDESMGYDAECANVDTIDDFSCDSSHGCAVWRLTLNIEDSGSTTNICDDTYRSCITESFTGYYTTVVASNMVCESDYDVTIYANVSFSSALGSTTYTTFISQYGDIVDDCIVGSNSDGTAYSDGNDDSDSSNDITTTIESSQLKVCDSCSNFFSIVDDSDTDDNNENSETDSSAYSTVVNVVYLSLIGVIALFLN